MKKFLIGLLIVILLPILLLLATGHGYVLRGISKTYLKGHSTANIDDYTAFNTRTIETGTVQEWPLNEKYGKVSLPESFLTDLQQNDAVAFLVAQNGKIVSENYFDGYSNDSKTNSFSMAKTVTTLLLAKAIEEGYIKGIDQPITDFLPEFKNDPFGKQATIGSLSTMSSGYNWDESYYSPFSPTVELYYGGNVENFVTHRNFSYEPDTYFYYSSASTELLGVLITRALQAKNPSMNISTYLSEKIWKPLGMNADAVWHLDNHGMELTYCCLNTNARNFAKLGQLLLQNGQWNGEQIIDSAFVYKMHQPIFQEDYGYSTWMGKAEKGDYFYFRGHLGQYIVVVPSLNMVLVRLGKSTGTGDVNERINQYINEAYQLVNGN